jgi:hypothetical protein
LYKAELSPAPRYTGTTPALARIFLAIGRNNDAFAQ